MRLYQLQSFDGIESFHRSFEHARSRISELDPTSRRKTTMIETKESGRTIFSNGYQIFAIDLKTDKEGILNELNGVIRHVKSTAPKTIVNEPENVRVTVSTNIKDQERFEDEQLDYEQGITDSPPQLVSPAIKYEVDDVDFPKSGKGTCLHCKKTVGYVGGFPRVNPPSAICD